MPPPEYQLPTESLSAPPGAGTSAHDPITAPIQDPAKGALSGLNAPMRHLVAAAELLDRQRLTPEARTCARAILQCSRMVLSVLEDLRQMGEVTAAAPPAAPVLLGDLIEEIEALWRLQTAPSAGRLLISSSAPAKLMMRISAGPAKQMINTLIARGLASSATSVVELSIEIEGDGAALQLCGRIGHDAAASDFAPYDSALPLAVAIASSLGGDIERERNAGSGETLAFRLPAEVFNPEDAIHEEDEESPLPARTHILIVDDNATNRTVASALCEMFGCTTQTADDGVEAVEAARASRFDLILMDIKMPRMDGIEATQAIRRLPGKLGRVPIVALTANGDADSTRVYLSCGMDAVVEKPIKPDRLLETLQWALDPERDEAVGAGTTAAVA